MGGYRRWLIARGNQFLPGTDAVVKLVDKLRAEGWIRSGYALTTVDAGSEPREALPDAVTKAWLDRPDREEIRLVWPGEGDARYPLTRRPEGGARWTLEVHRAPEYVYPVAKDIGPIDTMCRCGEDQAFEWDPEEVTAAFEASNGIFAECEECSRTFEFATRIAKVRNSFDGTERELPGGAAYRFALVVDCGDAFVADPGLALDPELVKLVETHFGREFFEVGARV
jgi:hypothetical protein